MRFPRRLKVDIDIPEELDNARVPALLLQPLVENAIKYGVSGTRETVTLEIRAAEAGPGRFTIEVINSGATASTKAAATASPTAPASAWPTSASGSKRASDRPRNVNLAQRPTVVIVC